MRLGACEIYSIEDVIHTNDKAHAELERVLHSDSPFHINIEKAADVIRAHRGLIDNPRHNFSILDLLIEHVESKIYFANDAEELVFNIKKNPDCVSLLNDAYCSWETALEQIFVMRLCSGSTTSLHDYRLNNRFQRLIKREVSMLQQKKAPRRVLFIGSGPFPISAIWLQRSLNVPVDGLDVSVDAIERSRELIEKLNLSHSINVIHEPSSTYDVSNYDVIVVALLAKPKRAILQNIYDSAKPECEIICRTSSGLRTVIYEPTTFSKDILEKFTIEDARIVAGSSDDTISSLLLKKAV